MRFHATTKDPQGSTRRQVVEAADRAAALDRLRGEGQLVVSLEEEQIPASGFGQSSASLRLGLPATSLDIEFGLQQLSSMLHSGLSLLIALRTAGDQARRWKAARLWYRLADQIEAGTPLSLAMRRSKRFDTYTLALIQVGEQSGELDQAMLRAVEQMEQRRSSRAMVINALIYPIIVLLLTFGVTTFMVVKVIPQIQEFLQTGRQTLPAITQLLLDISDALRLYAPHAALTLGLLIAAWFLIRLTSGGRQATDAFLLRIPVSGRILRLAATAALARGLSILLESGLPLLDALQTSTSLFKNARINQRIENAREAVIHGETLAQALTPAREFMPMLPRMTAVGESTGTLPQTLAEVARFHETQLLGTIRRFGILMEPLLIFIVGGIVGFVYTAFFMALFTLGSVQ